MPAVVENERGIGSVKDRRLTRLALNSRQMPVWMDSSCDAALG